MTANTPDTQEVRKARINAYLTSGAILFLSLLIFFYFHKEQDDSTQKQITELQSQLAAAQKENKALREDVDKAYNRTAEEPAAKPEAKPKPVVPPQTQLVEPTPPVIVEPEPDRREAEVYITRTGAKYHRAGCLYLSRSQIPISRKDAIAQDYEPCSRCNP